MAADDQVARVRSGTDVGPRTGTGPGTGGTGPGADGDAGDGPGTGLPALLYDGECGFCTASASWIARRWAGPARAVPWQRLDAAALHRLGLTTGQAAGAAWWVDERGTPYRGHLAIAHALSAAGGWWGAVGRSLGAPPLRWLAAAVYPAVVAVRHRLPGATPACRVPGS